MNGNGNVITISKEIRVNMQLVLIIILNHIIVLMMMLITKVDPHRD